MALHEDQREANRAGLQAFNTAVMLGLTNANIAAITTTKTAAVPPLATAYTTKVSEIAAHEDQRGALIRINKAAVAMEALGVYTDALLAGADTAAEHRTEIFLLADATLDDPPSTLQQQGGILFGE